MRYCSWNEVIALIAVNRSPQYQLQYLLQLKQLPHFANNTSFEYPLKHKTQTYSGATIKYLRKLGEFINREEIFEMMNAARYSEVTPFLLKVVWSVLLGLYENKPASCSCHLPYVLTLSKCDVTSPQRTLFILEPHISTNSPTVYKCINLSENNCNQLNRMCSSSS